MIRARVQASSALFGIPTAEWMKVGQGIAQVCGTMLRAGFDLEEVEEHIDGILESWAYGLERELPKARSIVLPFTTGSIQLFLWQIPPKFKASDLPDGAEYFGSFPVSDQEGEAEFAEIWATPGECWSCFADGTAHGASVGEVLACLARITPAEIVANLPLQIVAGAVLAGRRFAN